jgi:hypothetical protein
MAIVAIAVLAAAACGEEKEPVPPSIGLPSRSPRGDAGADARSNILEPADTGPIDTGPPPDPFCSESGLVLCFTFDDAVENLAVTTPKLVPSNVIDVSLVGGKKNKAARFDTGSAITFDYAPLLEMQAATVEAWVNRDLATFANDTVFDDDQRFAMTVEADGTLRCKAASAMARGGKVGIEQWVHVACVFDGTNIEAYVGGTEVASVAGAIGVSSTAAAAIGDDSPSGGEGFAGELDSLRVFNVARTPAQISAAAQN